MELHEKEEDVQHIEHITKRYVPIDDGGASVSWINSANTSHGFVLEREARASTISSRSSSGRFAVNVSHQRLPVQVRHKRVAGGKPRLNRYLPFWKSLLHWQVPLVIGIDPKRSSAQTPTTKPMRSFESAPFVPSTIRQIAWKKRRQIIWKLTPKSHFFVRYRKT
jgi:hypothetical protein